LVLNCEGGDLLTHELRGDFVFIGRASSNHIVVDHPAVSAQHALLLRVRDSYRLMDLNSTNGTQINGMLVTDTEVNDGDKVRFGSVVAVFVATDQAGAAPAATISQNKGLAPTNTARNTVSPTAQDRGAYAIPRDAYEEFRRRGSGLV
jgi:ABC transport system ATP-binding/permease protein